MRFNLRRLSMYCSLVLMSLKICSFNIPVFIKTATIQTSETTKRSNPWKAVFRYAVAVKYPSFFAPQPRMLRIGRSSDSFRILQPSPFANRRVAKERKTLYGTHSWGDSSGLPPNSLLSAPPDLSREKHHQNESKIQ